jgi:hypothetical protein
LSKAGKWKKVVGFSLKGEKNGGGGFESGDVDGYLAAEGGRTVPGTKWRWSVRFGGRREHGET